MWPFLGSLISAGSSLLGGLFGQSNQQSINQQNIAAQESINQQNIAEQEKFAQQGVQWKVADAKAAGINPLAALGASTSSFSDVVAPQAQANNSFGTGIAGAGQDLARAIGATRSPEEQAVAAQKTALDLEGMQLDNDIKRASIASSLAKVNQAGVSPGLGKPPPLPGAQRDYSLMSDSQGNPVLSKSQAAQSAGFDWVDDAMWHIRNRLPQAFGYKIPPELAAPQPYHHWVLDPDGVYRQTPDFFGRPSGSDVSDWMKGGGLS